MTRRSDYMKQYKTRHRERLKLYKRLWTRKKRGGLKYPKISEGKLRELFKKHKMENRPDSCAGCGILLASSLAGTHNGVKCETCLANYKAIE